MGFTAAANAGGASSAPTAKSRNIAYNFANSLAAHCRGGVLLHPRGLAVSQDFSGRTMLAPTMKLKTSDIIFMKILPFACRGLHGRPANGAGVYFRGCGFGKGGVFGVGCGAKRKSQRSANAGEQCSPLLYNRKGRGCFCVGLQYIDTAWHGSVGYHRRKPPFRSNRRNILFEKLLLPLFVISV